MRGSIIAAEERKSIGNFLSFKIGLTAAQILCSIFGILELSLGSALPCDNVLDNSRLIKAFIGLVIASQIIDATILFCCGWCLLSTGKESDDDFNDELHDNAGVIAIWENRCRKLTSTIHLCFCNTFGGANIEDGFDQVARVLTNFFHNNGFLDIVASDVVAGIILLRVQQRSTKINYEMLEEEYRCKRDMILATASKSNYSIIDEAKNDGVLMPKDIQILTPLSLHSSANAPRDIESLGSCVDNLTVGATVTVEEIDCWSRCIVFALAVYSHLMAIYMNPCTGPCQLCCQCIPSPSCPACRRRSSSSSSSPSSSRSALKEALVEGDNCCRMNSAGLTWFTKLLENTELLYVSFKNDTTHKPYGVFLDHEKEWLVIAIRGTLSLEDCITDAACEPEELVQAGEAWGFDGHYRYSHGGMLKAAMHIRNELEKSDILNRIYSKTKSSSYTTPLVTGNNYSHYRLVVTGHSLGAGTACILTLLLKAAYPKVVCYSFGTPASVFDETTAEGEPLSLSILSFSLNRCNHAPRNE